MAETAGYYFKANTSLNRDHNAELGNLESQIGREASDWACDDEAQPEVSKREPFHSSCMPIRLVETSGSPQSPHNKRGRLEMERQV